MRFNWVSLVNAFARFAPAGSPRNKLLTIISIILVFEGLSVLVLFSYTGAAFGIFSMALGGLLLLLITSAPGEKKPEGIKKDSLKEKKPTLGVKLVDAFVRFIGGTPSLLALGGGVIAFVVIFNLRFSANAEFGDLDTLAIMLGAMLLVFPFIPKKFNVEAVFALVFLGLVVAFLVIPQFVISLSSRASSSLGGAYVHYMLAAPFAGILDLIGINSSSYGNVVSLTFHDGTLHSLTISAYCAGMYSFSIFVSAFIAFVLVFENMSKRLMAAVLGIGLLAAYLGNLFRMVVIGIVGYYKGMNALTWAHENVGWIIFLAWSAVFWYLVMRYADKRSKRAGSDAH